MQVAKNKFYSTVTTIHPTLILNTTTKQHTFLKRKRVKIALIFELEKERIITAKLYYKNNSNYYIKISKKIIC